jgi:nitrogen regulatory protein PII
MHFKLIIIMVEDHRTQDVLDAARAAGATGCTVLNQARGEGIKPRKSFLGLSIDSQVDVVLMLAEEHMSREIMEKVAEAGEFEEIPGAGIAFQIDVEDAIGVQHQIEALVEVVEDMI